MPCVLTQGYGLIVIKFKMADYSDFEAFYQREKAKADLVLPPSRHLFFANQEDTDGLASESESSTIRDGAVFTHAASAF